MPPKAYPSESLQPFAVTDSTVAETLQFSLESQNDHLAGTFLRWSLVVVSLLIIGGLLLKFAVTIQAGNQELGHTKVAYDSAKLAFQIAESAGKEVDNTLIGAFCFPFTMAANGKSESATTGYLVACATDAMVIPEKGYYITLAYSGGNEEAFLPLLTKYKDKGEQNANGMPSQPLTGEWRVSETVGMNNQELAKLINELFVP